MGGLKVVSLRSQGASRDLVTWGPAVRLRILNVKKNMIRVTDCSFISLRPPLNSATAPQKIKEASTRCKANLQLCLARCCDMYRKAMAKKKKKKPWPLEAHREVISTRDDTGSEHEDPS